MPKAKDLTGHRSGNLVVQYEIPSLRSPNGASIRLWMCKCDCGKYKAVRGVHIANGKTISCGCIFHRHTRRENGKCTRTYTSWYSMKNRCSNPNDPFWKTYGGRGVRVCDEWSEFKNFLRDMGERPNGTTLDRFPNHNGNYEPGNCRWATPLEQGRNSNINVRVEWNGTSVCLSELAEINGVSYSAVKQAYRTHGKERVLSRMAEGSFRPAKKRALA